MLTTLAPQNLGNRDAGIFVAATTNFDGAGKWKDDYSAFFAGKKVTILPDNDEPGEKHALRVAASIYPHAIGVKIVRLPGLQEKGDVSDYLKSHTDSDLLAEIQKAPRWHPPIEDCGLLVPIMSFLKDVPEEIDWLVTGVIQRGANGVFCADAKGAKSFASLDMALSLAIGVPWLGFDVPKPTRVALISREDTPGLTAWRTQHLLLGKRGDTNQLQTNLYINTGRQSKELMLDNEEEVIELMSVMKQWQIEFAIFDVFNVMHAADENDNTEMRTILRQLSRVQAEVGCCIGVAHHYNKAGSTSTTQRLRGSSAIAGWAEWLIGLTLVDEVQKIRRMEFELKAAQPPDAIGFKIHERGIDKVLTLEREELATLSAIPASSAAARYMKR